jgi:Sulfotransferase domain
MKVIGAGLPRTATTTTLIAFEQLGFAPCYHMRDVLGDLDGQLSLWERVVEGDPDWEAIFGSAESMCDFPASRYYRELLDVYPDAKLVLSVRSAEGWVRSMRETIWPIFFGDSVMHHVNEARRVVDRNWDRFLAMALQLWADTNAVTGDDESDADLAAAMERWNEQVKASVPVDRLLVWEPAQGWEPLCEFLDVAVPDGPVPNVNDTSAFKEGILGGGLDVLNAWWDQRERPTGGLHGAPASS